MRCIFCKNNSSESTSVEHIVPESLGNESKILRGGIVCDQCNHYFGTKIEKSFMEIDEIVSLRFIAVIPSKRRKIPPIDCTVNGSLPAKMYREINSDSNQVTSKLKFSDVIQERFPLAKGQRILIEYASIPKETALTSTHEVSRFIAKVALELFAYKQLEGDNSTDFLVDDPSFDAIRNYARYGSPTVWPCNIRRIYEPDKRWPEENEPDNNITFEGMFLFFSNEDPENPSGDKAQGELFCVLAIWGIEFAINMGHPSINTYLDYLCKNDNLSPLHPPAELF